MNERTSRIHIANAERKVFVGLRVGMHDAPDFRKNHEGARIATKMGGASLRSSGRNHDAVNPEARNRRQLNRQLLCAHSVDEDAVREIAEPAPCAANLGYSLFHSPPV